MTEETLKTIDYKLQHDTFFGETFKMPTLAIAFLKQFLPPEMLQCLDLEKLTVGEAKLIDDLYRKTWPDMIYHVPIIGLEDKCANFNIVLEHKSYDDHSAIFQISKYVNQFCVQDEKNRLTDPETKTLRGWTKDFRLAPVIPIILHHGETAFTGETELANLFYPLPGAKPYLPHQRAILIDLSKIEKDQLPRDPNAPELHVVLVILKTIFSKDKELFKQSFCEIVEELQPFTRNQIYIDLTRMLWFYMINYAKDMTKADCHEILAEVRKTTETEGDKDMSTLAQIFISEGREEGFALGVTKGKAEAILRTLTWRFHAVPKSLQAQVFAITDLASLDELADFAYVCESLDDFIDAVK